MRRPRSPYSKRAIARSQLPLILWVMRFTVPLFILFRDLLPQPTYYSAAADKPRCAAKRTRVTRAATVCIRCGTMPRVTSSSLNFFPLYESPIPFYSLHRPTNDLWLSYYRFSAYSVRFVAKFLANEWRSMWRNSSESYQRKILGEKLSRSSTVRLSLEISQTACVCFENNQSKRSRFSVKDEKEWAGMEGRGSKFNFKPKEVAASDRFRLPCTLLSRASKLPERLAFKDVSVSGCTLRRVPCNVYAEPCVLCTVYRVHTDGTSVRHRFSLFKRGK